MDEEERNYCCLVLLLTRVGLVKIREFFINEWNSVGTYLPWTDCPQNGDDLLKKRKFKPLDYEKAKVQSGDTRAWDMSLFIKALLNSKPPLVSKSNKALVDGLTCLKDTRNTLCHTTTGKIKASEFSKMKSDVCKALLLIGASPKDIKKAEEDVQQPWNEVLTLLNQCASQDKDILKAIDKIYNKLREELKEKQEELKQGQSGLQQGQEEIKQGQSGLQQGQEEIKQGQSGLQQGQEEIKQGQSGLQQGQEEIKEEIQAIRKEIQSIPTVSTKLLSSEEVKVYSEKLKSSIKAQTEFQPKLMSSHSMQSARTDEIFTNLMIQRGWKPMNMEASERAEQLALFNKPRACLVERCQDIFINPDHDKPNPKSILVIGKPGIGKSLFCQKLCRDWSDSALFSSEESPTEVAENFEFVFLITFRQLNLFGNKEINLLDVLNHCSVVDQQSIINEALFDYISEHPEKVLFILDGFDEYSNRSNIHDCTFETNYSNEPRHQMPVAALMSKLLRKKVFRGSVVIVTSRPTEADELAGLNMEVLVEIAGFSSQQVEEFIERYFKSKNEEIRKVTKEHIMNNENLLSLAHIPVLCYLICWCLEWHVESRSQKSLPTTITALYSEVVEIFELKHHFKSQYRSKEVPENYNVPAVIKDTVEKLSQLAAATYRANKLLFSETDIEYYHLTDQEINNLKSCGLITCGPSFRTGPFTITREYCFSHLTLHEYFAALGFVDSGTIPTFRTFGNKMVFQFCAGLLSQKKDGGKLMEEIISNHIISNQMISNKTISGSTRLLAATLLHEYGDKALCIKLIEMHHSKLCNADGVLFEPYFPLSDRTSINVLTWFLGCLNEFCALRKDQVNSSSEVFLIKDLDCKLVSLSDADQLAETLKHNSCPIVTLRLRYGGNKCNTIRWKPPKIFTALPSTYITELELVDCLDKQLLDLGTVVASTKIVTLKLRGSPLGAECEGLLSLIGVLPSTCITTLCLSFGFVKERYSFIILEDHVFLNEGWLSSLIRVLPSTRITTLKLKRNSFSEEDLSSLSRVLPSTHITILRLISHDFRNEGLSSLIRVLPSTCIITLKLGGHGFNEEWLSTLERVLPSTRITTLHLGERLSSLHVRRPGCFTVNSLSSLTRVLPSTSITTLKLKGLGVDEVEFLRSLYSITRIIASKDIFYGTYTVSLSLSPCEDTGNLNHEDSSTQRSLSLSPCVYTGYFNPEDSLTRRYLSLSPCEDTGNVDPHYIDDSSTRRCCCKII